MKHHEVVLDLSRRGIATFVRRMVASLREPQPSATGDVGMAAQESSAVRVATSQIKKP